MADALNESAAKLYNSDFYAWTVDQASKLRARATFDNRGDIDWEHAAAEMEGVGASEKRDIRSRLKVLILHLMKWRFQSTRRKSGLRLTIDEQRDGIALVIADSPSLRPFPREAMETAYRLAVSKAHKETRLKADVFPVADVFPAKCPFTIQKILDPDFFPVSE